MTFSGGSGEERNLVPFPAGESRFICNPVHLSAAALTTLSLRETLTQTCGVDRESVVRMMGTETTFETFGFLLPRGFAQ